MEFEALKEAIIECDLEKAKGLTQQLVEKGAAPSDIINKGLINGMSVVGVRFKAGDMFVPEVMMAAKAMNESMKLVEGLLPKEELHSSGKVILGTVAGDLHDIGKNLVGMMMDSTGMEVIDLGIDVPPQNFVDAVREHSPQVVGMSALLTTTMLTMKETIDVLQKEGLRDSVKIIVGGAPVTQEFADEIGADGWAADAVSAKDLAMELIS